MGHVGSLLRLEFRVGEIRRSENALVIRNPIMEHASSRQKESDRDGVPPEGCSCEAVPSCPFLEGEATLAAACKMD